eukprot:CAMPEP_0175659584 /NCGR_PEP_ID=MMETSP0097-20121207/14006_1 /TAXON_ID=311494 /ORGANISM="Alexandrium monilatum, Strain CCMP3105" /LENGTH=238 /DNA_ID=CAMNT_0016965705 /DNA_START=79 /DNA_END=791 /DNA_ORIENTATION=+
MGKVKQTRRKLSQFFNWRVSVTLTDGRVLVGTLMAVDRHVNLVLCNTEEYRKYKVKGKPEGKELKRMLGFIVCRGRGVLYVQPEELQKEELVETEKPKKKAAAKAAPAPAAPAGGAAAAATAAAAAKLGGVPGLPPGILQTLPGLAGLAPPGWPPAARPAGARARPTRVARPAGPAAAQPPAPRSHEGRHAADARHAPAAAGLSQKGWSAGACLPPPIPSPLASMPTRPSFPPPLPLR